MRQIYKTENVETGGKEEQPMGDVYDVFAKASGVHSDVSGMSEDYTLTRYDIDIYNQKLPKFIREQRKVLRIIRSYMIIPKSVLGQRYSKEKAEFIYKKLINEFKIVNDLLIGELDECVIMGRTPKGEVIQAFLKHGLNQGNQENYDSEIEQPDIKRRANERR